MHRFVCSSVLTLVACAAISGSAFAQAQSAAPTTPAPAAKARFLTPLKGVAAIEVIQGPSKFVGKEIHTLYKIKNVSSAPIALLKIDEYWYDKAGKMVSAGDQRYRQPFSPGEIIELTTKSPALPGAERSQATFSHANGTVKPKSVKKFQ